MSIQRFATYCADNHLSVNASKTKYMRIYIHRREIKIYLKELTDEEKEDTTRKKAKKLTKRAIGGEQYRRGAKYTSRPDYKAKPTPEHTVHRGDPIRTFTGQEDREWAVVNVKGVIGILPGELLGTTQQENDKDNSNNNNNTRNDPPAEADHQDLRSK